MLYLCISFIFLRGIHILQKNRIYCVREREDMTDSAQRRRREPKLKIKSGGYLEIYFV